MEEGGAEEEKYKILIMGTLRSQISLWIIKIVIYLQNYITQECK